MAYLEPAGSATEHARPATQAPSGPPDRRVDPLAADVVERWRRGNDELLKQRRDYWQNLSMFYGEQWVWWDRRRNLLQALPQEWSPLGRGRARVVVNRMRPNLMSLLGRMLRSQLEFDVPPSDPADDVAAGAMLAADVLAGTAHDQDWSQVRYDENFAKFIGGTAAVAVDWNAAAGTTLAVKPDTNALVGTGDVCLHALAVTEFCLEPGVRDDRQASWWIQGLALDPKVARRNYDLDWEPSADISTMLSPLQQRLLEHLGRGQGANKLCLVLTLFERPSDKSRSGRYAVVVNGRTIVDKPWPFKVTDRLNLFVFRQTKAEGSWIGSTFLNDAMLVQVQYNFMRSIIAEHAKKVGNARLMAPHGSFQEEDLSDDPGSVLWYTPDVGAATGPSYIRPPDLPRWLVGEAGALKAELDDIMFVHDTSRGQASFDRASGQALALLAEKDDSPLGLMATEEAQRWSEIGAFVLRLYEDRVSETRRVHVMPRQGEVGVARISRWNGKMLRGQTRVNVPLESTLPVSQAAQLAYARDLMDRKIITTPQQFARIARLPQKALIDVINADVAKAQRENARMLQGEVAIPADFDDHAVHIAEHNRFRKTDSYAYAPQQARNIADMHIMFHEKLAAEELGQQVARAGINPALARLPQAHEPAGSVVPPDFAEMQAGLGGPPMPNGAGGPPQGPPQGAPDLTALQGGSVGLAAGGPPGP